jgi:hypothetical protein
MGDDDGKKVGTADFHGFARLEEGFEFVLFVVARPGDGWLKLVRVLFE